MKRIGLTVALLIAFAATINLIGCGGPKMVKTSSGLQYIDHVVGTGAEAVNGKTVFVHYTGWLDAKGKHGAEFDSSRDGDPIFFVLGTGRVIAGWEEGLQGMKVGGKRELFIPSQLGYGESGMGALIPPNAGLIFECELVDVK